MVDRQGETDNRLSRTTSHARHKVVSDWKVFAELEIKDEAEKVPPPFFYHHIRESERRQNTQGNKPEEESQLFDVSFSFHSFSPLSLRIRVRVRVKG